MTESELRYDPLDCSGNLTGKPASCLIAERISMTSHHTPGALPCSHLQDVGWPFRLDLVIDDEAGFTDALVSCRTCGMSYLLEMLDWLKNLRVMRIASVAPAAAAHLLRDLERGSCDPGRAAAETQQVRLSAQTLDLLLLIDASRQQLLAIAPVPTEPAVPTASWRALPCDGSWVRYARSYRAMLNGQA